MEFKIEVFYLYEVFYLFLKIFHLILDDYL